MGCGGGRTRASGLALIQMTLYADAIWCKQVALNLILVFFIFYDCAPARRGSHIATRVSDGRRRSGPRPQPVKSYLTKTITAGSWGGVTAAAAAVAAA